MQLHEKWAIFFRNADKKEMKDFVKMVVNSEEGIMGAQEVLDRISLDEIEWKRQFDAEILEMDRATERYEREHWKELAEAKGFKDGHKKGYESGYESGRNEGYEEGVKTQRAAYQERIAELEAKLAKYEQEKN